MGFNGLHRKSQLSADVARSKTPSNEREDFALSIGEAIQRCAFISTGRSARDSGHDPFRHRRADVRLPARYATDGRSQVVHGFLLHDVAPRARGQGTLRVQGFVVHGQDQHAHVWKHRVELLDQAEAAVHPQRQVQNGHIGAVGANPLEPAGGGVALAADGHVGLAVDQFGQTLPHDGVIVDDHDP